jgi:hypothetical protein
MFTNSNWFASDESIELVFFVAELVETVQEFVDHEFCVFSILLQSLLWGINTSR